MLNSMVLGNLRTYTRISKTSKAKSFPCDAQKSEGLSIDNLAPTLQDPEAFMQQQEHNQFTPIQRPPGSLFVGIRHALK